MIKKLAIVETIGFAKNGKSLANLDNPITVNFHNIYFLLFPLQYFNNLRNLYFLGVVLLKSNTFNINLYHHLFIYGFNFIYYKYLFTH